MELKECYEKIGGDYSDVMNRLPNEALILKFLKKYAASGEFDKMIAAADAKDYNALFETTHNLKGMSANLSLTKINKTITEICEAVRHGEPQIDLEPLIAQAKADQAEFLEIINQM